MGRFWVIDGVGLARAGAIGVLLAWLWRERCRVLEVA